METEYSRIYKATNTRANGWMILYMAAESKHGQAMVVNLLARFLKAKRMARVDLTGLTAAITKVIFRMETFTA